MGGVGRRESNLRVDSLFASEVCSYLSPSAKDSWEAGTNEDSKIGPPPGDSEEEFGGAGSKLSVAETADTIVLKGHKQSSPGPSDGPKAHLKGHGEQGESERISGKVTSNKSNSNRPFHGTLRREEVCALSDLRGEREGSTSLGADEGAGGSHSHPEEQTSFWERTLPTNNWWELRRSESPPIDQSRQQVASEEDQRVKDFEMRGGLENVDLATDEKAIKDERRLSPKRIIAG